MEFRLPLGSILEFFMWTIIDHVGRGVYDTISSNFWDAYLGMRAKKSRTNELVRDSIANRFKATLAAKMSDFYSFLKGPSLTLRMTKCYI